MKQTIEEYKMASNMDNLLKENELKSNTDYFNMVLNSFINGQKAQQKEQFNDMPTQCKKDFIKWFIEINKGQNYIYTYEETLTMVQYFLIDL